MTLSSWTLMLTVGLYAFLLLFLTTLIISGLKDILQWDGRAFGAIVAIFVAVMIYYAWPWLTYDPMRRMPTFDLLGEAELLSRLKAAFIGALIGTGVGAITWQYFRSSR